MHVTKPVIKTERTFITFSISSNELYQQVSYICITEHNFFRFVFTNSQVKRNKKLIFKITI